MWTPSVTLSPLLPILSSSCLRKEGPGCGLLPDRRSWWGRKWGPKGTVLAGRPVSDRGPVSRGFNIHETSERGRDFEFSLLRSTKVTG